MTTPINFELAKLLKEKGFDDECQNSYTLLKEFETGIHINSRNHNFISAPTISKVVMWLYEKHGIWVFAFRYSKVWQWKVDDEGSTLEFSTKGFNSPTEAYEAAIEYTLKNLI